MIKLLNKLSTIIAEQVNNKWLNLPFDRECLLCRSKITSQIKQNICTYCDKALPRLIKHCPLCCWPLPANMTKCDLCISLTISPDSSLGFLANAKSRLATELVQDKTGWTDIKILFPYTSPIDRIIQEFKYFGNLAKGRLMSEMLVNYLLKSYNNNDFFSEVKLPLPEVIIPVPIHSSKLKHRGFNQTVEVARYVSKKLNIPMDTNLVAKYQATAAQMSLDKVDRQNNLEKSFCLNKRANYKSAVIIDDVVTTGSTVTAIAKLLQKTNIKKIYLWALARRC